ncbi:hypothetical protein H5410_059659 [Solanum commersonii]|uniref:Uncharacterized protein n=1 Tax=Solanum commersonii TaxID=4109 RepID=A0A9J5W312_SOLCO|nr:hypothetical protein H5410_059659 [Solanum commersonii]
MLNKLFGGKKWTSATEGRTNPYLGRHGRPKYASFCMPERSNNPPLGRAGPYKLISFSMPERSDNPPLGFHGPAKLTSFSMPERSDNPPLSSHYPPESASFSVPGQSNNTPLDRHGPRVPAFVPGRSDDPRLGRHGPPKSASFSVPGRLEIRSSSAALKIIHVGGIAEYYYMATPASRILDKYPSFILAKPEVFKKPWDSVVHKDEILIPGQKYYVIPQCTLKKLRRRIKKNNHSFTSQDSTKSQHIISIIKTKTSSDKNNARNRRVRFFGIDCNQDSSCSVSLEMINKENEEEHHGKIRANRNVSTWKPTLTMINEK